MKNNDTFKKKIQVVNKTDYWSMFYKKILFSLQIFILLPCVRCSCFVKFTVKSVSTPIYYN